MDLLTEREKQSALDAHMKSFDNLGFNNEKVYSWRKSILEMLLNDGYNMSSFYFTRLNSNNKELLENIAMKENTYNFLNSKRLINTGYCPITGEEINNTYNFNIFNRVVYLSKRGLEVCKRIDRDEWNNNPSSIDYDTFEKLKQQQTSSSCFIATACYGNYNAPEVLILRKYRDDVLLNTIIGTAFVKFYYFVSPPLAKQLEKYDKAKSFVRKHILQPIVKKLTK